MEQPENKRKKQGDSIKLPQELQESLRQFIAPYFARGEKPPARGELLLNAWRQWLSGVMPADSERAPTIVGSTQQANDINEKAEPPVLQNSHTEGGDSTTAKGSEQRWARHREAYELLEAILDDGPPGMAADITGNLRWFALAAKAARGERPEHHDIATAVARSEAALSRAAEAAAEYRRTRGDTERTKGRSGAGKKRVS